jgi:hypothetical protein
MSLFTPNVMQEFRRTVAYNVLQLQVRGGIRSRNVSACTGVEYEANSCKLALHPP